MPLILVGLVGAVVGVGVYELFLRPVIAPAAGLNPTPTTDAAAAPPGPAFPSALGHLTPTTRTAGAMGSAALAEVAEAAVAQVRGRR